MLRSFLLVLSVELGFWIPIVNGILDSLSCIPDSKAHGFRNPLHRPIYALLIKREVTVAVYWPSPFFLVFSGPSLRADDN